MLRNFSHETFLYTRFRAGHVSFLARNRQSVVYIANTPRLSSDLKSTFIAEQYCIVVSPENIRDRKIEWRESHYRTPRVPPLKFQGRAVRRRKIDFPQIGSTLDGFRYLDGVAFNFAGH